MNARVVYGEPADQSTAWALAVRVAGVAGVLTAVVAFALQRFMGLGNTVLVVLAAAVALAVGLRLPPAAPAFLQVADPLDAEIEQFLDDAR